MNMSIGRDYAINASLPQCVLTLRLIGVAFDLLDGARASVSPSVRLSGSTCVALRSLIASHATAEAEDEAERAVGKEGRGARAAPGRAERAAVAARATSLCVLLQRLARRPAGSPSRNLRLLRLELEYFVHYLMLRALAVCWISSITD